jgi:hypothetical protein
LATVAIVLLLVAAFGLMMFPKYFATVEDTGLFTNARESAEMMVYGVFVSLIVVAIVIFGYIIYLRFIGG